MNWVRPIDEHQSFVIHAQKDKMIMERSNVFFKKKKAAILR